MECTWHFLKPCRTPFLWAQGILYELLAEPAASKDLHQDVAPPEALSLKFGVSSDFFAFEILVHTQSNIFFF